MKNTVQRSVHNFLEMVFFVAETNILFGKINFSCESVENLKFHERCFEHPSLYTPKIWFTITHTLNGRYIGVRHVFVL